MNYINIWYCMGAAALAIAGTYIFWGPSNRPKRRKNGTIPGMQNLGNSCFLNAVLQALAACPSFINWLQEIISSAREAVLNENYVLIKALYSVLNELNSSADICTGGDVIQAIRKHGWIISNEEQDAHELFHVLTTTIEEEIESVNPVLSLLDARKLEDENDEKLPLKSFISLEKPTPTKTVPPICGLLVSELRCNSCNSKHPARYDNFDSISLVIPSPHWGQLTLQDLLMKFISCELVQDVTCEICTRQSISSSPENNGPKFKTIFTKQLSFGKLPKCLCIHIQRTVWLKNGLSVKCYDYVSFPEILIMDHFVHCHMKKNKQLGANFTRLRLTGGNSMKKQQTSSKFDSPGEVLSMSSGEHSNSGKKISSTLVKEECSSAYSYVYWLKAVIVHLGDTSSGHFITYRRGAVNTQNQYKWFCVSDLEVKEVSFSEVSRSCAYMVFYEKLN